MVILCAFIYFCMMFICGWYFGKKDAVENGVYDIGFRYHAATYLVCIGISYVSYYSCEELAQLLDVGQEEIIYETNVTDYFLHGVHRGRLQVYLRRRKAARHRAAPTVQYLPSA